MVWPKYVWCPKNLFSRCPDRGNHHLVIRMPELGYWYVKINTVVKYPNNYLTFPVCKWRFEGREKRESGLRKTSWPNGRETARTHSSHLRHRHESWTLTGNNEGRRLYHLCSPNLSFPFLPTSADKSFQLTFVRWTPPFRGVELGPQALLTISSTTCIILHNLINLIQ